MRRITLCLTLLSLISVPQQLVRGAEEKKPIELTLTPREIEQPLLQHRLLPAEFELQDGNAATIILRMPWEQQPYMQKVFGTFDDDLELSIDDPKIIENGTQGFDHFFDMLKRAAFRRTADWEYPIGEEATAYILLPDVQGGREFVGKELSVWIRYHIAKGELDQAREGILVGLAVSRHYARTPFVIVQLVGQAIDSMMLDRLSELVARPDCPNLYWSLTALPRPLLSSQPAIEFEERFLETTLPRLEQIDGDEDSASHPVADLDRLDVERSAKEWEELAQSLVRLYAETGGINEQAKLASNQLIDRLAKQARKELPEMISGGALRVMTMSDDEAGVRWFLMRHRELSQEITAMMSLEPKHALLKLRALQIKIKSFREELEMGTLFNLENPLNLYLAVRRNDRRIAMLRIVEGIRQYAATHDGGLPQLLVDLKETPAPDDAILDRPFEYTVEGDTATLSAPDLQTIDSKIDGVQYRIRIRKPAE
jgi:hypothetical protein